VPTSIGWMVLIRFMLGSKLVLVADTNKQHETGISFLVSVNWSKLVMNLSDIKMSIDLLVY